MTIDLKVSPSDLTYLWDECPRCFYNKVRLNKPRPYAPFPSIFNQIDGAMKGYYQGKDTLNLEGSNLPPGKVAFQGKWVTSEPTFFLDDSNIRISIRGIFDTVLKFYGLSGYGIIDYKTITPSADAFTKYARQLHAYKYAMERPAPGKFAATPVTRMGLICFKPEYMAHYDLDRVALTGKMEWVEVPIDKQTFLSYMELVTAVLDLDEPPPSGEKCNYCTWLKENKDGVHDSA